LAPFQRWRSDAVPVFLASYWECAGRVEFRKRKELIVTLEKNFKNTLSPESLIKFFEIIISQ
jgi:hypothetical protein